MMTSSRAEKGISSDQAFKDYLLSKFGHYNFLSCEDINTEHLRIK